MTDYRASLGTSFLGIRALTERLCEPLTPEDCNMQSVPFVSPPKWHLAHTTWFFETFLLRKRLPGYEPFHSMFGFLFNSYYESVGPFFEQARRGLLSRPSLQEIFAYRARVDEGMLALLEDDSREDFAAIAAITAVGLSHEQQHQELLLMDTKHNFACNPLRPVYRPSPSCGEEREAVPLGWVEYAAASFELGHDGKGFSFDNERPAHEVLVGAFRLGSRLVTNAEYLEFMQSGGYERPELWLSDGWTAVRSRGWRAPLYWESEDGEWRQMTLSGMCPVRPDEPVCHVSYYEADAFARWAGKRLPTESEWERAARHVLRNFPLEGNFLESGALRPLAAAPRKGFPLQLFGDVWEWTMSAYSPFPGFRPAEGPLGEYNGKFMCGQMVLRGGAAVTPGSHIRPTYRNFFTPDSRWQFGGIRLAETVV